MSNCGRTLLDHISRFAQVTQLRRTYHLAKFMESILNRLLKPVILEDTLEPLPLHLLLLQYHIHIHIHIRIHMHIRIRIHIRILIRISIHSHISRITSILI